MEKTRKIIVILGPNASGKTGLSIKLAKKFDGEIISADSRQVYKGMDIGTGKVTKEEMESIPHYLLDVADPKERFDVAQYKKLADKAIDKIFLKNKVPFVVGGTGFYIQALVDNMAIPKVKPDWKLRAKLEKMTVQEMYQILAEKDPRRAKTIDKNNPRRLIRALEIVLKSGRPIPPPSPKKLKFEALFLGVKRELKELNKLIEKRLLKRLDEGMADEIKKLHLPAGRQAKTGVSWKRLEEFGLEYRYVAQYLQGKLTYEQMVSCLQKEIEHYAKRQIVWFKRDKRINWLDLKTKTGLGKAGKLCEKFLKQK